MVSFRKMKRQKIYTALLFSCGREYRTGRSGLSKRIFFWVHPADAHISFFHLQCCNIVMFGNVFLSNSKIQRHGQPPSLRGRLDQLVGQRFFCYFFCCLFQSLMNQITMFGNDMIIVLCLTMGATCFKFYRLSKMGI